MPHGIERRTFEDPESEPERVGVRPLQVVCVVGVFASALIGVLAFDEVSLRVIVLCLGFAVVLVLDALWRGLRTGKLAYRGALIDGVRDPLAYFGMILFYLAMVGLMIYYGVDLWLLDA